jgi:hypothetical protein
MSGGEDDPYADLKRHRWPPDASLPPYRPKPRPPKQQQHFVRVPIVWVDRLERTRVAASYRVALHLLYRSWKMGSRCIDLPNGRLTGVSRWQKWRALSELEQLGLIAIKRRKRKAPLVTVLLT